MRVPKCEIKVCFTAADYDLPRALAGAWFGQLQIVSVTVCRLEFWELLRGYKCPSLERGGALKRRLLLMPPMAAVCQVVLSKEMRKKLKIYKASCPEELNTPNQQEGI